MRWQRCVSARTYGEVGREEGSGWGACDFFLNKIFEKKKIKLLLWVHVNSIYMGRNNLIEVTALSGFIS